MSPAYLLDTNLLSEPAKPRPDPAVIARWQAHAEEIVTAAPAWHELCYGVGMLPQSLKRTRLESYLASLANLQVLPYDAVSAERHARLRADLKVRGLSAPWFDGQIAAVALVNGLVLVTRNLSDFQHFPGLRTENWFSS